MLAPHETISDWAQIVRAEYNEMPGQQMTQRQIQRRWNLDPAICEAVIASLMSERFLRHTPRDAYARFDEEA